jgi:hypothetical protein
MSFLQSPRLARRPRRAQARYGVVDNTIAKSAARQGESPRPVTHRCGWLGLRVVGLGQTDRYRPFAFPLADSAMLPAG